MSDLISRSALLKALSEAEDNYRAEHHDCVMDDDPFSDGILSAMFSVFQIVKSQPTAYDIDKVVAELESNSFITVKNEEVKTKRKDIQSYISVEKEVVLLKDAIEIVKQGSVCDDVCEWNLDGVYIFSPHKKIFNCVIDDKHRYTYCPVCGKKIKVVE